jgi:ribosomal protein L28
MIGMFLEQSFVASKSKSSNSAKREVITNILSIRILQTQNTTLYFK